MAQIAQWTQTPLAALERRVAAAVAGSLGAVSLNTNDARALLRLVRAVNEWLTEYDANDSTDAVWLELRAAVRAVTEVR